MTGGAAFAASSGLRVRGRWRAKALPSALMATLEMSPNFHCGGTLGQPASCVNVGTLRVCGGSVRREQRARCGRGEQ